MEPKRERGSMQEWYKLLVKQKHLQLWLHIQHTGYKANVLHLFYDYRYGHATGKGTARLSRTASLFQPELVPEMVVLFRNWSSR